MYKEYFKTYHVIEIFLISVSLSMIVLSLVIGLITYFNVGEYPLASLLTILALIVFAAVVSTIFYFERKKIVEVVTGKVNPVYEIENEISLEFNIVVIDKVKYIPYKMTKDLKGVPRLYKSLSKPDFFIKFGYTGIIETIFYKDSSLFNKSINNHKIKLEN